MPTKLKTFWNWYYNFFDNLIGKINNNTNSILVYFAGFTFIITIRNLLEYFSNPIPPTLTLLLHYSTFYLALAVIFVLIISAINNIEPFKVARAVMIGFFVILLPPIIDMIFHVRGEIAYLRVVGWDQFLIELKTFFYLKKGVSDVGATLGIRLEVIASVLFIFYYVFFTTKRFFRSLFTVALTFLALYLSFTTPFLLSMLENNPTTATDPQNLERIYLIIFTIGGFLVAFLQGRYCTKAKDIFKNIRFLRLFLILILTTVGYLIAAQPFGTEGLYNLLLAFSALSLSWIGIVMLNDVEDFELDSIDDSKRPLIEGSATKEEFLLFSFLFTIVSVVIGFTASPLIGLLIICFNGLYFLYSAHPFRFKTVPFISKFILTAAFICVMLIGFDASGTRLADFPFSWPFIILFALCINFIDLKDYKGDKYGGIKTLPVILGLTQSKKLVGLFFITGYSLIFLYTKHPLVISLFLSLGIFQYFFINQKEYKEKPVLIILLISFIFILYFLSTSQLTI